MYSFFVCFVVFALCSPGTAADKVVLSQWTATAPIIDGSNSDWEGGTLTLYKKAKIDYAFRNDADNLYVIFIFNEPTRQFMSTIQDTGLTLWFNTDGTKKKKYGIKFAIRTVSADNYIQIVEEMMGEPMPDEKKQQIKAKESYQIFHNEVIDKMGEAPAISSGPTAPSFNTAGRRGEPVVYEFKVPLSKDETHPVGIGTTPGGSLTIGFGWGGTTKESRQQAITRQTARGSAGSAAGSSGSLTGETRTGGGGGMNTMKSLRAVTYIFWADVKLADKQ